MTMVGSVDHSVVEARPVAPVVCDIRGFSNDVGKNPREDMAQALGVWFRETGNMVAQAPAHRQLSARDARVLGCDGAAGCRTGHRLCRFQAHAPLAESRNLATASLSKIAIALPLWPRGMQQCGVSPRATRRSIGRRCEHVSASRRCPRS